MVELGWCHHFFSFVFCLGVLIKSGTFRFTCFLISFNSYLFYFEGISIKKKLIEWVSRILFKVLTQYIFNIIPSHWISNTNVVLIMHLTSSTAVFVFWFLDRPHLCKRPHSPKPDFYFRETYMCRIFYYQLEWNNVKIIVEHIWLLYLCSALILCRYLKQGQLQNENRNYFWYRNEIVSMCKLINLIKLNYLWTSSEERYKKNVVEFFFKANALF